MQIKRLRFVLAIFAAFILAACTPLSYRTYGGAQLPSTEIAFLSVDRQIFVISVDTYATGITSYNPGQMGMELEIVPGPRKVIFNYSSMIQTTRMVSTTYTEKPIEATYDFKKGRKYELHYKEMGKTFDFQIVDVTDSGSKKASYATWGRM